MEEHTENGEHKITHRTPLEQLPHDLIEYILLNVSDTDSLNFALTCKYMYDIAAPLPSPPQIIRQIGDVQ